MVLVSTAILARLLSPDDFGVVGYALTSISFLDVISDMGMGNAIIYFPEEKRTSSTGFWVNQFIGLAVFFGTWLLAPLAGLYFRDPRVVPVLQVLGFVYPLRALGGIHGAVINKRLQFGKSFLPDILQGLTKGLASIIFAWYGFGAWSLIWGYLLGTLVSSIAYWLATSWKPSFDFSVKIAKDMLDYGFKIIGLDIIAILLVNLDYLLIGRYLGAEALGIYTIAFRLPDLLILQFARILSSVLYPIYTHIRNEPDNISRGFYMTSRYISLITVPLGLGLSLVAYPLTIAIFSEKWAAAAPVLSSLAIYTLILSLSYNTGSIYKAQGRPQVLTWLALMRLSLLFPALWWAVTIVKSITLVGLAQAVIAFIGTSVSLFFATRLMKLPVLKLLDAFRPAFLAGSFMALTVYSVLMLVSQQKPLIQLAISVPAGGIVYILVLFLTNRELLISGYKQLMEAVQPGKS